MNLMNSFISLVDILSSIWVNCEVGYKNNLTSFELIRVTAEYPQDIKEEDQFVLDRSIG